MSTDEKPLHVAVAEALGWTELSHITADRWTGKEPYGGVVMLVPSYNTSWCSSGPLLERLGISLDYASKEQIPWSAYSTFSDHAEGKTPCEAVARLIVNLAKEGKLPK